VLLARFDGGADVEIGPEGEQVQEIGKIDPCWWKDRAGYGVKRAV